MQLLPQHPIESNPPIQPAEPSVAVNQPLHSSQVSSQVYSYHQPYPPPPTLPLVATFQWSILLRTPPHL